jgi:hypothetical protein
MTFKTRENANLLEFLPEHWQDFPHPHPSPKRQLPFSWPNHKPEIIYSL